MLAPESPSRHKCLIYDGDPSEQLAVVVPLLLDGLADNHRCLYLGDETIVETVRKGLAARGLDVAAEVRRKALVFSSERASGRFEPEALIGALRGMIDEALRDGFAGLCATGDMRFELGDDDEAFDRLLEYEARLEVLFREKPLRGICQYDRALVPPRAVRDALITHRSAHLDGSLNVDNFFYVPPELLLENPGAAIRDRQGEWMLQQITRVARAERERDRARDELARANEDLERRVGERTAELSAANRELESFSYSLSHDLRAPLRQIDGFASLLEKQCGGGFTDGGRRYVRNIREAARRMSELTTGLLALARLSNVDLRREPVDLSAVAREVVEELRSAEPERKVESFIQPHLASSCDPGLIRAALTNLLANAWKFTAKTPNPRVEFSAEDGPDGRTYHVRDNGAGFDMAHAGRLFKAFERLHSADDFPGTGIGLATTRRIIERHGGRIRAAGAPGRGADFSFSLPADAS